jgi:hypothetical protein
VRCRCYLSSGAKVWKAAILERAVLRLTAKFEIQSHENRGLRAVIIEEKKRKHRGKRLNLLGEEAASEPQFFSPTKVIAARAYQENKEAAETDKRRQRLYVRKKLPSNDSNYKRRSRKLLDSVNCGRRLIKRQWRRKRRKKQQKERKSAAKKGRINNRKP